MIKLLINRYTALAYILLLVTSMVAYLGDTGIERVDVIGFRGDYVVHLLVYMPWMTCGDVILRKRFNTLGWYFMGVVAVVGLEVLQAIIPYRGYNINDLIAGVIGVTLSWGVWMVLRRWLH